MESAGDNISRVDAQDSDASIGYPLPGVTADELVDGTGVWHSAFSSCSRLSVHLNPCNRHSLVQLQDFR